MHHRLHIFRGARSSLVFGDSPSFHEDRQRVQRSHREGSKEGSSKGGNENVSCERDKVPVVRELPRASPSFISACLRASRMCHWSVTPVEIPGTVNTTKVDLDHIRDTSAFSPFCFALQL